MTLTPQQRTACAELLSRGTGMNCFEEAALLLDTLTGLIEADQKPVEVIRWLTLLPRVKDKAAALAQAPVPNPAQLALVSPVTDLPTQMQRAMEPARGQSKDRPSRWLLDPNAKSSGKPTSRAERAATRRPATGTCADCGTEFPMNPVGRPATKCAEHRRSTTPRQESA